MDFSVVRFWCYEIYPCLCTQQRVILGFVCLCRWSRLWWCRWGIGPDCSGWWIPVSEKGSQMVVRLWLGFWLGFWIGFDVIFWSFCYWAAIITSLKTWQFLDYLWCLRMSSLFPILNHTTCWIFGLPFALGVSVTWQGLVPTHPSCFHSFHICTSWGIIFRLLIVEKLLTSIHHWFYDICCPICPSDKSHFHHHENECSFSIDFCCQFLWMGNTPHPLVSFLRQMNSLF